jgi:hypothetical protein
MKAPQLTFAVEQPRALALRGAMRARRSRSAGSLGSRVRWYALPMGGGVRPDVDAWARDHGFRASREEVAGATPLLRLGELDTTDDAYRGSVGDSEALLVEFSIGSPGPSQAFGGVGLESTGFTLFLVGVDATRWPRVTVHPSRFSDHDWIRRALGDDRVAAIDRRFDDRYRVIASNDITDDQLRTLFTDDIVDWWLDQTPELIVDVEDHHDHGGYLAVAHLGIGIGDDQLTALYEQAERVLAAYVAANGRGGS